MKGQLIVMRRFNVTTDMVAHDNGTPKRGWVIAMHVWPTGWDELVFSSIGEAQAWAASNDLTFENRIYRRQKHGTEARP
jgi:hypothetical protein